MFLVTVEEELGRALGRHLEQIADLEERIDFAAVRSLVLLGYCGMERAGIEPATPCLQSKPVRQFSVSGRQ